MLETKVNNVNLLCNWKNDFITAIFDIILYELDDSGGKTRVFDEIISNIIVVKSIIITIVDSRMSIFVITKQD